MKFYFATVTEQEIYIVLLSKSKYKKHCEGDAI